MAMAADERDAAATAAARLPRLAVTPGEPAGIGPELVVHLVQQQVPAQVVAVADPELLAQAARAIRKPLVLQRFDPAERRCNQPGELFFVPIAMAAENEFGFLRRGNAPYVLATLQRAVAGCLAQEFDALVTGPVQKSVINEAGIPFTGHTEFLSALCGGTPVLMMLACGNLRVALATTHLPLRDVPAAITPGLLRTGLRILEAELRDRYGLRTPRIRVLGLNPHAGEGGHLGREEIDVIAPVLAELRGGGMMLEGPVPADTAFGGSHAGDCDAILAMYHDQGLPALKQASFGQAVNITLGLPFVRVSVDHGTALDLAGKGIADPSSLLSAVAEAIRLTARPLAPLS